MKTMLLIVLLGTLALAGPVSASSVTNVGLSYENGGTVARVTVQGPIRFTHQTEIPKDGKPDRMILDVIGASNDMAVKSFSGLPPCGITAIRTSQYAVKPEKIVRLVFDMSKAPIYRVESEGTAIKVVFTDNSVKSFSAWSANSSLPATTPTVKPAEKKPATLAQQPATPATSSTPEQKAKATEQDRQSSLASTAPTTPTAVKPETKPSTPAAATPTAVKPETKPSTPAATTPTAKPEVKPTPTVASAPTPAAKPAEAKPEAKSSTPATTTPTAKPEVKPTPTVASAPTPAAKPAEVKPEAKPSTPAATTPTAKPEVKPTPTVASAPTPTAKAAEVKPEAKPTAPIATPVIAANTQPATATVSKLVTPEAKPTDAAKPVSEPSEELAQGTGDDAQFAATDTTKSTARFRRNPVSQTKIKGTLVAEFPQRLVVKYEGQEFRDPFAPLLDDTRTFNSPVRERMPNIEGLKLVGIIESSEGDNRALFEDKSGYSYMLQSGDKVQKGYVLRVERDRVYFQIFEYGWSRTIALAIEDVSGQ